MIRVALALLFAISTLWLTILTVTIKVVWNLSLHSTFPEQIPTINFSQAFGYAVLVYVIIFISQFKLNLNNEK